MNFYNTLIGKVLNEIKIAYLSHTPIVYIPTDQKELITALVNGENADGAVIPRLTYNNTINQFVECNGYSNVDNYHWNAKLTDSDIAKCFKDQIPCCLFIYTSANLKSISTYLNTYLDYFKYPKNNGTFKENINGYRDGNIQEGVRRSLIIVNTPSEEKIPEELAPYTHIIRIPQLTDQELEWLFWSEIQNNDVILEKDSISKKDIENIVVNLRGFSMLKVKNLVKTMILTNAIDDYSLSINSVRKILLEEKKRLLDNSISLHWEDKEADDAIGLKNIQKWLTEHAYIFRDPKMASKINADIPKGILVSGIPGSGKSLMAKQVARELDLPLISMDMAAMRGGVVGESEHNMIRELKLAESMSPCVLWIDEIEKALSGSSSSSNDSGVAQRMFGKFLTWMQEKKDACFIFATSNDVTSLPPELFRSERFDSKYYTFLPSANECANIFTSQIISANKRHEEKLSSMSDIEKDSEFKTVFEKELEDIEVWKKILNEVNDSNLSINKYKRKNEDSTEIDVDALDSSILGPRNIKIFSGSDISAILKIVKHRILSSSAKTHESSIKPGAIFSTEQVVEIAKEVISKFKPYGETNIKDVVKCYLKLMINQFTPATDSEIISFAAYDISTNSYVADINFAKNLCAYDRALYYKVVSAINYYSPGLVKER